MTRPEDAKIIPTRRSDSPRRVLGSILGFVRLFVSWGVCRMPQKHTVACESNLLRIRVCSHQLPSNGPPCRSKHPNDFVGDRFCARSSRTDPVLRRVVQAKPVRTTVVS